MGIYTEAIRKKEENNRTLETYADTALKNDKSMYRLENEVDDAQSALMYVLDMFKLSVPRVYGCRSIEALLESVLDPLGMMYRYAEQASDVIKDRTEYIIAAKPLRLHPPGADTDGTARTITRKATRHASISESCAKGVTY